MNTILISGTARHLENSNVKYVVKIWASLENSPLTYIREIDNEFSGYSELWAYAKQRAKGYFLTDNKLDDGAYTQYLDHLILLN